jgi:hypothetical protein
LRNEKRENGCALLLGERENQEEKKTTKDKLSINHHHMLHHKKRDEAALSMIWQNNRLDHRDTPHTFPKESKLIPHANI